MSPPPAPARPIRVITVEDDPRYRASLEMLLAHSPGFTVAGSYPAPAAALADLDAPKPPAWDLVLMDLEMPGMSGVECTRRIKAVLPNVAVVVLTVFENRTSILEAICAGADGYLLKHTPSDQLVQQLGAIVAGGSPLSAGVAKTMVEMVRQINGRPVRVAATGPRIDLTPREADVLRCLVEGMSYKGVASRLDVSIDTVRSHIRAVYRKLQVHSVSEAVSLALHRGLV